MAEAPQDKTAIAMKAEEDKLDEEMMKYFISEDGRMKLKSEGFISFKQIAIMRISAVERFLELSDLKMADKVSFLSLVTNWKEENTVDSLSPDNKMKAMTDAHKEILRKYMFDIANKMRVTPVLVKLYSMGTITEYDMQLCQSKATSFEQSFELLMILQKGVDRHFTDFIKALEVTNHLVITKQILGNADPVHRSMLEEPKRKRPKKSVSLTAKFCSEEHQLGEPEAFTSYQKCEKAIMSEIIEKDGDNFVITNRQNVQIIEEHGRIIKKTETGSIRFLVYCPDILALEDLWQKCSSGKLKEHFLKVMKVDYHKTKYNVPDLQLEIVMDPQEVEDCMEEIKEAEGLSLQSLALEDKEPSKYNPNISLLRGLVPDLLLAVLGNDVPWATEILESGEDPNLTWEDGMTGLHVAAQMGYPDMMKLLLKFGTNIDQKDEMGQTALHVACLTGNKECVKILLAKGADFTLLDDIGHVPIHTAIAMGNTEVVCILLRNVDMPTSEKDTALHLAAKGGYRFLVALFCEQGVDINSLNFSGRTSLSLAAGAGHLDCVRVLLEAEADANIKDKDGITALHWASLGNHADIVEELLRNGADSAVLTTETERKDIQVQKQIVEEKRRTEEMQMQMRRMEEERSTAVMLRIEEMQRMVEMQLLKEKLEREELKKQEEMLNEELERQEKQILGVKRELEEIQKQKEMLKEEIKTGKKQIMVKMQRLEEMQKQQEIRKEKFEREKIQRMDEIQRMEEKWKTLEMRRMVEMQKQVTEWIISRQGEVPWRMKEIQEEMRRMLEMRIMEEMHRMKEMDRKRKREWRRDGKLEWL